MKGMYHMAPALSLLAPAILLAADGHVINATTGAPAANILVMLVRPGPQGMQPLATTKSDAAGKFTLDKAAEGPSLIQAIYQGITYNKVLMPGAPTTGLEVTIYDSTNKPGAAEVTQHMILVQPSPDTVAVSETYLYGNNSKLTYNDPGNGTLQFYLPPEAKGQVRVTVNAPGGMPVERPASETKQKGVYKLDYPIKPGETRIDLAYSIPATDPVVLEGKILHKEGKARLVAPQGVTLTGDTIQSVGVEPTTQASIYDIIGNAYKVTIQGTGSLQPEAQQPDDDSGQPQIREVKPHIYDHMYWIAGLTLGILGLGSWLLARKSGQPAK